MVDRMQISYVSHWVDDIYLASLRELCRLWSLPFKIPMMPSCVTSKNQMIIIIRKVVECSHLHVSQKSFEIAPAFFLFLKNEMFDMVVDKNMVTRRLIHVCNCVHGKVEQAISEQVFLCIYW